MNQITVVHPDSTTFNLYNEVAFCAPAKATQKMALLSDDLLSITVNSATPLSFCLGDIINVYGKGYRLNQLPGMTKQGNRIFTYELQLEGAQYDLLDVTFQLPEGSYGDNLYGDLSALVDALKWNVRRVFGNKWNITTALTGTAHKNLAVTGKNCLQVAQELCSEFGVEFMVTITGNTVTMEFVKTVGTTLDLTLRYGQGNGLYQLQRTNVNNAGVTTRLFCYGSSENLGSGYRHTKLCLPNKTRLTSYIEDAGAIQEYGVKEGEKVFSDIRPERIGHVTAVASGDVLSFYDSEMDFDLNAKDPDTGETLYLLPETAAQIKFISGNLGGYTFDLHSYDHATKKFTINQFTDENGVKFPDAATAARQFSAANGGDEYIITDIQLPQSYIDAAETKLQEEGTAALEKICQPQVSYKLTLDENFFIDIYGRTDTEFLHVGDSVTVVDSEIGVNKAVRITRIERDLLRPHSYDITLSDTVTKNTTIKVLNDITEINEVIQNSGIADTSKMRRRWMATKELQEMVFDPDGYFDPENIKPLSVETSMLTVAAKSQQFTLVGSLFQPNLGGACNDFYAQGCRLVHYALDEQVITFTLTGCTYSQTNGNPLNTSTAYYIYARCSKVIASNAGTGDIILSTTQYKAEGTSYYYFLIGVLNSAVDGVRAISLTYGATTINGAFITTGRIQSQDENTYLDLDGNAFVMGNGSTSELSWNKGANGKLVIKGGLVQNTGGNEAVIGLYRGVYSTTNTYYPGDEVTYTANNVTSTYRHIGTSATRGIAPTNTTYWQVLAKGEKGANAVSLYKSTAFIRLPSSVTPSTPTGGDWSSPLPTSTVNVQEIHATFSWSDGIPEGDLKLWATTRTFYSDNRAGAWSTPRPMTDTETYDVEFSNVDANPGNPTDNPTNWHDPSESGVDFTTMLWRAEREKKNGEWGSWTIVRIKGEKGEDAEFVALEVNKGASAQVKKTKVTGGYSFAPGTAVWKAVKVKGSAKTELSSLPTGYYMKLTRIKADGTTQQVSAITNASYSIVTGTLFSNNYNYARMDLFDDNDEKIASADVTLTEDGADAPYYKYKYQWSGSRTAYPTPFNPSALNAGSSNWKDSQPTQPGTLYYLWRTTGKVSADGTTLVENWTTPIRVTPTENTLQIEVKGTKHNGTSSQAPIVRVYGSDITGRYGRGHNLKVLNASDLSVAYEGSYDTYTDTKASQTNTTSLYNKLMQYASEDYIIVVYSYDALSMLSKLYGVLQKFGCNYRTPELIATRLAFAFIGRWGFTPGQGYTKSSASEETVEIAASVIDGKLVANGSDGVVGDNLIDNSEAPETFGVTDSSSAGQFFATGKVFNAIPEGQTISGQARITLSGCTFPSAGASILLYLNSQSAWPRVCEITGITANGTYDLKTELTAVPTGISTWQKPVWVRLNNFYTGGTITIERVKVEVGAATEYSLSVNDRRGASTPYRGAYDSNKTYYGTARRTDVVKYDGNYYVARADVGTFTNKVPTNTDYWNDYGAQFESVATQLLFAEFAYVENLGVRDLQTAQSGRRVHVSADDNAMTIYDDDGQTCAVFSGDQFDDGELFGGADVTVSPTNVDRTYRTGDALHANMQYQETVSCGTFNFGYAGVFTGSCRLSLQSTGSYSMGSGTPSRMFHATIEIFVDNSYIGSWSIGDVPQSESALYVAINKAIAAGNHSISARITIENPNYTSGSYQVTVGAIFINCKASADIRMARYFANGQALGCSSSQYMEALLQTVGSAQKLLYKVRAGNCGIRFYDGTMQIMIAGIWYTCSRNSDGTLKLTAS